MCREKKRTKRFGGQGDWKQLEHSPRKVYLLRDFWQACHVTIKAGMDFHSVLLFTLVFPEVCLRGRRATFVFLVSLTWAPGREGSRGAVRPWAGSSLAAHSV